MLDEPWLLLSTEDGDAARDVVPDAIPGGLGPRARPNNCLLRFFNTGPAGRVSARRVILLEPTHRFEIFACRRTWLNREVQR